MLRPITASAPAPVAAAAADDDDDGDDDLLCSYCCSYCVMLLCGAAATAAAPSHALHHGLRCPSALLPALAYPHAHMPAARCGRLGVPSAVVPPCTLHRGPHS